MQDEIVAGLKNAMERGYTLEQAIQSFINAGYNPQEVKAAGDSLSSGGASNFIHAETPVGNEFSTEHSLPDMPAVLGGQNQNQNQQGTKSRGKKVMLLVLILIVLVVFVGVLSYLIYTL